MITTSAEIQGVYYSTIESLNNVEESYKALFFELTQQALAVNEEQKLTNVMPITDKATLENTVASKLSSYCLQLSEIMKNKYNDKETAAVFQELGNNQEKLLSVIKPILEKLNVYKQLSVASNPEAGNDDNTDSGVGFLAAECNIELRQKSLVSKKAMIACGTQWDDLLDDIQVLVDIAESGLKLADKYLTNLGGKSGKVISHCMRFFKTIVKGSAGGLNAKGIIDAIEKYIADIDFADLIATTVLLALLPKIPTRAKQIADYVGYATDFISSGTVQNLIKEYCAPLAPIMSTLSKFLNTTMGDIANMIKRGLHA